MYQEYNEKKEDCQEQSSLVKKPYLKTDYRLLIYENMVSLSCPQTASLPFPPNYGKRKAVSVFSHTSRMRLLRLFSRVNMHNYGQPFFVTLTYHHAYKREVRECASDLNCFLQNIRNRYPSVGYIWRLEFQKRGAPHFHIIFFPSKQWSVSTANKFIPFVSKTWHRVADPGSKMHRFYGCLVISMNDYRHAFAYMSKYVAKEAESEDRSYAGRRWGASRKLDCVPVADLSLTPAIYMWVKNYLLDYMRLRLRDGSAQLEFFEKLSQLHVWIPVDMFLDDLRQYLRFHLKMMEGGVFKEAFVSMLVEQGV
jgi:hypothetical protein